MWFIFSLNHRTSGFRSEKKAGVSIACLAMFLLFFFLTGCSANQNPLQNSSWVLVKMAEGANGISPPGQLKITLRFGANNSINGFSGCNSFNGTYTLDSNKIQFSDFSQTKMACDAALMRFENVYIPNLERASEFTVQDDTLTIVTDNSTTFVYASQSK